MDRAAGQLHHLSRAHLTFFGPSWLLYHASGTVMIYALYLRRRNLPACMLLHFLVNLPILLPASGLLT